MSIVSPAAHAQKAEQGLPEAGAEQDEAEEVDGTAEQGEVKGARPHDEEEVLVLLMFLVTQAGVADEVVEGVRQGEDEVGDGGGQDGHGHLSLLLAPRLVAGRRLHVLRAEVVTAQRPDGDDVDSHQTQEGDVGHEDGGRRAEAVGDVGFVFVEVRAPEDIHLFACPRAQFLHIHTHTHTYTHIHSHTHTYIHTHTLTYTHIHTHTHTYTHIHTHTHTYTHILTHTHTYTHIHSHTHTYTHIHTHTHTYTHIHTHTHTYTHRLFRMLDFLCLGVGRG